LRERITDFDASDRLSRDDLHRRGPDIELVAMRPYLEAVVRIAIALDHPAYDCM